MDKVQHFEIPADNISRARKFYESSFGWSTMEFPMPGGTKYFGLHTGPVDENNMWKESGFINGGMFQRDSENPVTAPTIAATVADINATFEKIKEAGGSIVTDTMEIPEMGLYAYVKDTEGNVIGVFQELKKNE